MDREEWLDAIQRRDVQDDRTRGETPPPRQGHGRTVLARWRVKYLGRTIEDCVLLTDIWVQDDGRGGRSAAIRRRRRRRVPEV